MGKTGENAIPVRQPSDESEQGCFQKLQERETRKQEFQTPGKDSCLLKS